MMPWPEKKLPERDAAEKKTLGKGVFRKCDGCGETLPSDAFAATFEVCPECGRHAMYWRPWYRQEPRSYRCLAVCPDCPCGFEF